MKIDKLSLDGKKDSIEVLDKIFSGKIYKQLVNNVLYKTNANYKGRHAKTKQKNEIIGSTSKIYAQKGTGGARHAREKLLFLLAVVQLMDQRVSQIIKKENLIRVKRS